MLKKIFKLTVTNNGDGINFTYNPPMVMHEEKYDNYPTVEVIESEIIKYKGDSAVIDLSYKLI